MSNLYDKASLIVTPNAYKASKIYSAKPTDGSGDLVFSRASTAMRRNSAGLWESVSNNVPRLHYPVGGGCPSWLFEPQETCLIPNSNIFTGGCTKTTGITDSPISGVNSVRITKDSASTQYIVTTYTATITNTTRYVCSLFFKYDGHNIDSSLEFNNGGDWGVSWRGNIEIRSTGITVVLEQDCTAVVVPQVNGWYRLEVSFATTTVTANTGSILIKASGANGASFLICTLNLTQSTFALSTIANTGGIVTRNADVISKTGLGTLLSGAKGLFVDCYLQAGSLIDTETRITAMIGDSANPTTKMIYLYRYQDGIGYEVYDGSLVAGGNVAITTPFKNKRIKLFISFETNNIVFYVNAVAALTDTSNTIPVLNSIAVGNNLSAGSSYWDGLIKAVAVTDELTESEIAQLSSYPSFSDMASEMIYETV